MDETESLFCLPGFLNDSSLYGAAGKVVVQEWAKLRWGVFEEHGYPGDQSFPLFFYKVFRKQDTEALLLLCVSSDDPHCER